MPHTSDGPSVRWGYGHIPHSRIPEWILDSDISDRALRLYAVLARYADDTGLAFPSKKKLSGQLRCVRSTLDEAFKDLDRIDAVKVVFRHRDDGGQTTNDYVLNWACPPSDQPDPPAEPVDPPTDRPVGQEERVPVGNELTSSLRSEDQTTGMPKLPRVNGRDLPLDVLAEVCGIDQANRTRMREAASALNGTQRDDGIKQLFWIEYQRWLVDQQQAGVEPDPEALTHALVQMIRRKAGLYRERFADAELTPSALRKWWLDLESKPAGGSVSGDDVRRGRA